MRRETRYTDMVEERQAGNEVIFWRQIAEKVEEMARVSATKVSVMLSGELGNRVALLSGSRCDETA